MSELEILAIEYILAIEAEKEAGNKFVEFLGPKSSKDYKQYFELQKEAEDAGKAARLAFSALSSHVKAAYADELESTKP